jgi:hypothetical protein
MIAGPRGWMRRIGLAAAALLALAAVACAGASPSLQADSVEQTPAAVSADQAVAQYVEGTGADYAGDCASTRSPQDVGKVCSKFIEERAGVRAYLIGRTFSEFSTWVFVEQTTAGWTVKAVTPLDFFDTSGTIPWPA